MFRAFTSDGCSESSTGTISLEPASSTVFASLSFICLSHHHQLTTAPGLFPLRPVLEIALLCLPLIDARLPSPIASMTEPEGFEDDLFADLYVRVFAIRPHIPRSNMPRIEPARLTPTEVQRRRWSQGRPPCGPAPCSCRPGRGGASRASDRDERPA